ncbi:MAG: YCF48-related protein [Ignavibacteria bacterium]
MLFYEKNILILIILTLTISSSYAQWFQQYPVTPFNHLYDVKFINKKTGWTCGNMGTIMKTTNGGNDWIRQNSQVPGEILNKIFPVDSEVVYCVGYFETILKSTDGGTNWSIIRHSSTQAPTYNSLFFLNRNVGWMAKNQYVLKTTNGGITFDSTFVPATYINDLFFRNLDEGLFCGEGATIYRTTNGGASWNHIPVVPKGQSLADFMNLTFVNASTGFTQGRTSNIVFKTANFGLSWDSIGIVTSADECYSIFFPSLNKGWCAGTFGRMFKTTNGGQDWIQENLSQFNEAFINSLWFFNDSIGWAVGAATKILYTNNGGKTGLSSANNEIPKYFSLHQNYPNPFNSSTLIKFDIKRNGIYKMDIFNSIGQLTETIFETNFIEGSYEITYEAEKLTSGIYFYNLSGEGLFQNKKFSLIK